MNPEVSTPASVQKRHPALWAVCGFLLGAAAMYSIFEIRFQHKGTDVWVSKGSVHAGGIEIPAGTKFIHTYTFSEGFYQVALHLNINGSDRDLFDITHDQKSDEQFPYWVGSTPAFPAKK